MRYYVEVGDRTFEVELAPGVVRVDGREVSADLGHVGGTPVRSLLLGGRSHRVVARKHGAGAWRLGTNGLELDADVVDERVRAVRELTRASAAPTGPRSVRAPMPGLVVKVEVAVGQPVEEGQGLVIVEAMKMENELRAEGPGTVTGIHVTEGQTVEKDQVLVDLGPAGAGD